MTFAALTPIRVFMASSSELGRERKTIPKLVEALNRTIAEPLGMILRPWQFESELHSGFLASGIQGLINPQLDAADVVISVFWRRLGLGTAEEYQRAFERWGSTGKPRALLFRRLTTAPNSARSLDEWRRLMEFFEAVRHTALIREYRDARSFEERVRDELGGYVVQRYRGERDTTALPKWSTDPGADEPSRVITDGRVIPFGLKEILPYPPDAVYAVLRDHLPELAKRMPAVEYIQEVDRTNEGVDKLRSSYKWRLRLSDIPNVITGLVSDEALEKMLSNIQEGTWFDTHRRVEWHFSNKYFHAKGDHYFEPAGSGTRFTVTGEMRCFLSDLPGGSSPSVRSVYAFGMGRIETYILRKVQENFADLVEEVSRFLSSQHNIVQPREDRC